MTYKEPEVDRIIIASLIKFQDKLEYLEDLQRGKLYMNTLRFFMELAEKDNFRGDRYEGLVAWYQPDRVTIKIIDQEIDGKSLAAPVALQMNCVLNLNAFCMYTLSFNANQKIRADQLQEFEDSLRIHKANFGHAKNMLITTNTKEFLERVRKALQEAQKRGRIYKYSMGLVNYFDDTTFHGNFDERLWGFIKRRYFAPQKEYRIIVDAGSKDKEPFELQIGDCRDITIITTPEDFNKGLKVLPPS
ncbi:MAG: hypothetical protein NZ610_01215 [Candidatus Bipolaricaulota bacterium]|nr:hypothetical protein [Candidatus Bipolaricaulota bacterium]MCS7274012.1 hypothetical protein [Candidatus Bipolaricaulota bacterium]MDW8111365.1 hypothetical protein [Candidatus Bipolaricaulota bacterium]MDW8329897.1 hypothetical protein [Candidatus Bipolaricaulota bacterium]